MVTLTLSLYLNTDLLSEISGIVTEEHPSNSSLSRVLLSTNLLLL